MNNTKTRLLLMAAGVLVSLCLNAATFETIKNGSWNSPSTWANGQVPSVDFSAPWPGNLIVIKHQVTASQNLSFTQQSGLTIESTGRLTINGHLTVQTGNAGQFNFWAGSRLTAQQFQAKSNNATYIFGGQMSLQELSLAPASVSFSGQLTATNLKIDNGSSFVGTGGSIELSSLLRVGGGCSFSLTETSFSADRFDRTDGVVHIYGGTFDLSDRLTASGGGTIVFDGTLVNVEEEIILGGSVGILVRGNALLNAASVKLSGAAYIKGEQAAGILTTEEADIDGGAFIQCAQNNCYYGPNSLPPSPLNLATGAQNLPVSWEEVDAEETAEGILLNWRVAAELNNDYFTVERSLDGAHWASVANIPGRGTDFSPASYRFTDRAGMGLAQILYYRLRQTDFDGTSTTSRVMVVQTQGTLPTNNWTIWPNPAAAGTRVYLQGGSVESAVLVQPSGQSQPLVVNTEADAQQIVLPDHLPAGLYFIQISSFGQRKTLVLSLL